VAAGEVPDGPVEVAVPDGDGDVDDVVLGVAVFDVTLGLGECVAVRLARGVLVSVGVDAGVGATVAGGGRTSR
jgi:hypothetical protein